MAARPQTTSSEPPSARLEEIIIPLDARIEELSDSDADSASYEDMGTVTWPQAANIAYLNKMQGPIRDTLVTATSTVQDKTLRETWPYLEGNPNNFALNAFGLPKLLRQKHMDFLEHGLDGLPAPYTGYDASRPWLLYWSLQGFTALGRDVTSYQQGVLDTFTPCQYPSGGFGGGFGQLPHLAATYAATLSLVMVGGKPAYDLIDRKSMWSYLGRMKQADGGFTMAPGGEEDIRGAFCALVVLSLLNLPLELPADAPARAHGMTSFVDKLGDWVSRCQTFEGGISAAPGNEAHGAYAFCGLGCLSLLGPPKETLNRYLNVPLLIRWLSSRQCAPEGGYCGRTNKLVDGCYSHWIGGCWAMVEAAAGKGLWNRAALARYILSAAQNKKGGLQDKPSTRPDGYHTCYNLAGLSAVQHSYGFDEKMAGSVGRGDLGAAFHWKVEGAYEAEVLWEEEDKVAPVHPVFVIPFEAARACREYFEAKESL